MRAMTHTTPKRRWYSPHLIRPWVQGLFVLAWLGPHAATWMLKGADAAKTLKARLHQIPGCTFHCYACPLATFACPIGVIASFSAVHLIPLLAIGVIVVVGSLVGSMVCGWACPAGFMQDLLAKVPLPKFRIPNWMGYGRYAVLIILVVTVPLIWGKDDNPAFICRLCPVGGIEAAIPNALTSTAAADPAVTEDTEASPVAESAALSPEEIDAAAALAVADMPPDESSVSISNLKITIIILFVAGALVMRRPWCTILCPLGGMLSLFNRVSILHLRFSRTGCTECNRCRTNCSYGVQLDKRINDTRCNRCLECTVCPGIGLSIGRSGRTR